MLENHSTKGVHLKTAYRVVHSVGQIFTGGAVEVSIANNFVACRCPDKVVIVDVGTGEAISEIKGLPDDPIQCMALSPNGDDVALCQRSQALVRCSIRRKKILKAWMGHEIPASVLKFHPKEALLVSGSPDRTVMLWDLAAYIDVLTFKVPGMPLVLAFHPTLSPLLAVGDNIGVVTLYDTKQQTVLKELRDHFSHCPSLCFFADGSRLYTCSHDKTVQVYDVHDMEAPTFGKNLHLWVVVEEILSIAQLDDKRVVTCGSSGRLRIHNVATRQLEVESQPYPHPFLQCLFIPSRSELVAITGDQCLLFYRWEAGTAPVLDRTLAGHLDAVADIRWLEKGRRFIVVTNSLNPRIFQRGSNFCEELHGHTDIPGSLAVTSDFRFVASAGKDKQVRLWSVRNKTMPAGLLTSHTAYITALAFTTAVKGSNALLLLSVDLDGFVRVWNCVALYNPKRLARKARRLAASTATPDDGVGEDGAAEAPSGDHPEGFLAMTEATTTIRGSPTALHALAIAPNNILVAGGGKAKIVYVWRLHQNALENPVSLKGHRRPITCVRFSPVDKILVSCCVFGHAMIWNLTDHQCIRTLQNEKMVGINQCRFLNHGLQLATTDALGMLKLWVLKTAECSATISAHSEEDAQRDVWALDIGPEDKYILTGGTDSRINVLEDFTETDRVEERHRKQRAVLDTQEMQNLMREGQWEAAVQLALKLNRKNDVRVILVTLLHTLGDVRGPDRLQLLVSKLTVAQRERLVVYCRDWNTHSEHCHVAQAILGALFRALPPGMLLQSDALQEVLEPLIAYNGRHYNRVLGLLQRTYLLDYALSTLVPIPTLPASVADTPLLKSYS